MKVKIKHFSCQNKIKVYDIHILYFYIKMKKQILSFFIFYLLFFTIWFSQVNALIDEDLWLDLYKDIESWLDDLELKQYNYNLTDWWAVSLSEKVNYLLWAECLWNELTTEDFIKIANWDIAALTKHIKDTCRTDNWQKIEVSLITEYAWLISSLHINANSTAQEKVQSIYRISRTWLYSDWNDSNSPFDLVIDLENINSIIFEMSEKEMYSWKDNVSLKDFWKNLQSNPLYKEKNLPALWWESASSSSVFSAWWWWTSWVKPQIWNSTQTGKTQTWTNTIQNINSWTTNTWSISTWETDKDEKKYSDLWYVCLDSTNKNLSWLDSFYTNEIIKNIEKINLDDESDQSNTWTNNSQNQELTNTWNTQTWILSISWATNSWQHVAQIQDLKDVDISPSWQTSWTSNPPGPNSLAGWSSQSQNQIQSSNSNNERKLKNIFSIDINKWWWKCLNFFCISIDFKTYTQNLFWSSWKLESIESIVKNSNNHLRKFAFTDLTQKMLTLAHYEDNNKLRVKDIKLKDIFNFNIITFTRQIPLINTDKNKAKEENYLNSSSYWAMWLIEQYYNSLWIEAWKANSIENIQRLENQLKAIQDSWNTETINATQKYVQFLSQYSEDEKDNRLLAELLYSKQKHDNIDFMNWMFSELASFTNSFEIYVKWIRSQILKMDKKPTW